MKYFRRLGMFKTNPGSGNQISYEYIDLCEWSFILELSEFGVDPGKMETIKDASWPECMLFFNRDLKRSDEDILFVANPVMFSDLMREADNRLSEEPMGITYLGGGQHCWLHPKSALSDVLGRRALVINLTSIRRRLAAVIEDLTPEDIDGRPQT